MTHVTLALWQKKNRIVKFARHTSSVINLTKFTAYHAMVTQKGSKV
jgi:hypothetical protein